MIFYASLGQAFALILQMSTICCMVSVTYNNCGPHMSSRKCQVISTPPPHTSFPHAHRICWKQTCQVRITSKWTTIIKIALCTYINKHIFSSGLKEIDYTITQSKFRKKNMIKKTSYPGPCYEPFNLDLMRTFRYRKKHTHGFVSDVPVLCSQVTPHVVITWRKLLICIYHGVNVTAMASVDSG